MTLISRTFAHISSLIEELQVKRFLAITLVGFLLLTTNVDLGYDNQILAKSLDEVLGQSDTQRPQTMGEWNQEARETEGAPGKRLERIGKESAEAFKEFGSGYAEGAQETARDVSKSVQKTTRSVQDKLAGAKS